MLVSWEPLPPELPPPPMPSACLALPAAEDRAPPMSKAWAEGTWVSTQAVSRRAAEAAAAEAAAAPAAACRCRAMNQ